MAFGSENFDETLDFSEETKEALTNFSDQVSEINNRNLDGLEREKLIEELKSQLLIKICSLGEPPEKIAELIDELNLGKVINKFDDNNVSPLLAYLQSSNGINVEKFIAELEKKGLNPNAKNKEGNTALHLAIMSGLDQKVLKEFVALEAVDLNAKNNNGKTPLDLAVEGQNSVMAKILIDKGGQLGAFVKVEGAKQNQNSGRQIGGFEDKVKQYNEEIQKKIQEEFDRAKELMEEIKQQKAADEINKAQMQRLEALKVQIEIHHDLMKFFAKELAKQQQQEEWQESQTSIEIDVEEEINSVADIDKLEEDKDDVNLVEIMGEKIDLSDKATINMLLHYYAMRGDLSATMAMVRNGGDINTTIGGRTVFEAAIDSGNSALFNQISIENPSVLNNLKSEYKATVFSELVKDVNLDLTSSTRSVSRDDSTPERNNEKVSEILSSKDDIDLRPSDSPRPVEATQVGISTERGMSQ